MREARAYNQSIYFMVAVPYALFGIGAFTIYRASRKRDEGGGSDEEPRPLGSGENAP